MGKSKHRNAIKLHPITPFQVFQNPLPMSTPQSAISRRNQDVIGFRRIFILFCALVVLPSILLSGFGIVAIRNEGQAEKERQRERSKIILNQMKEDFVGLLSETIQHSQAISISRNELASTGRQTLQSPEASIGPYFSIHQTPAPNTTASLSQSISEDRLNELRVMARTMTPGSIRYTALKSAPEMGIATVVKKDREVFLVFFLNEEHLREKLGARLKNDPDIQFDLIGPAQLENLEINNSMKRIVQGLLPESADSFLPEDELLSQRFPSPFDAYRLQMISVQRSSGMTVLYMILLFLLNLALVVGVILTSRLIWKETRISRLKTDFVSHVSHELRTPLTSIRMFIETLKLGRATSKEEQDECFDLLKQETERLSQMIERVLGYARLKSGRRLFNFGETHVEELCQDAIQAFRAHTLADTDVEMELTYQVEENLPPVNIDREAMGEVLLNLLGNAYKFTGAKKSIHILARLNRKRVHIEVQDNGTGVPRKELKRIFDRFYQGESLLSRPSQGSGLGLAITKSIVEGHRGKIFAENRPEGGSTFTIVLRVI